MEEKNIIALEIGSSKIKAAHGVVDGYGALTVKAIEEEKLTDCVRYGLILNVAEVVAAIRKVLDRLEARLDGRKVQGVYAAVGGRSLTYTVEPANRRLPSQTEISPEVIEELFAEVAGQPLVDHTIVDVTPREFRVDNVITQQPRGIFGQEISAKLNVISCRDQLIRNLTMAVNERLGLKLLDTVVRQLALGEMVLNLEECRLGCMLVDLGAETTTVSIYKGGVLRHLATLPMGSRNITRDITSMNMLEERAEELKITIGNALPNKENAGQSINDDQNSAEVNKYVSARAGEIISNILEQVKEANYTTNALPNGIILAGNGAKLQNFAERLMEASSMKVRRALLAPTVRIAEAQSNPLDSLDVISILFKAAKEAPIECLSPKPAPIFTPQEVEETIYEPTHTASENYGNKGGKRTPPTFEDATKGSKTSEPTKPEPPKGPSTFKKFASKLSDFWNNSVNENSDEFES